MHGDAMVNLAGSVRGSILVGKRRVVLDV